MTLTEQLRRDEGTESCAYQDSLGYWTIGVGRLIDSRKGGGLSNEEIDFLLENDIKTKTREVLLALPWMPRLSEPRQAVLIGMAFQMGLKGLLQFKRALGAHHFPNMRPTGPTRAAIHCHGARPAHANAAGEAIGQTWVQLSLDMRDDIKYGLIIARRHVITRKAARFFPPPDTDLELFHNYKTKRTGQAVQPVAR
jgi:hypothetical protein